MPLLVVSMAMIAQRAVLPLYQAGLVMLVASTLSVIAVSNMPRDVGVARFLLYTLAILAAVVAVFAVGITLVPVLIGLGR